MTTTANHIAALSAILAVYPRDTDGSALGRSRYNGEMLPSYTEFIFASCGGICVVCGENEATELGHIIPARAGRKGFGTGNIGGMCRPCNVVCEDKDQSGNVATWANANGIPVVPFTGKAVKREAFDATAYAATLAARGIVV